MLEHRKIKEKQESHVAKTLKRFKKKQASNPKDMKLYLKHVNFQQNYQRTFLRNSNDMVFFKRIHHKIKLKKRSCAIQTYIWQHEFWEK